MQNYTGHGWEGKNYNRDLDIKEIAKIIKTNLKKEYPKCKFSVQIQRYSMGQSLYISLMEAPFEAIIKKGSFGNHGFQSMEDQGYTYEAYSQLNQYTFKEPYENAYPIEGWNNGCQLTKEAWDCMKKVSQISTSYNYDDSDGMIDYFNTNFYLHLNIGKWDKPFKVV